MVELKLDTFYKFIEDKDCIIQFSAQWCHPCKVMSKTILSCDISNLKYGKIDIDKNEELMIKYKIRSVPTIIYFKNGSEVSRILGTKSKEDFVSFINSSK